MTVVMMDCRSVRVPALALVIWSTMNVKRHCLCLQRAHGQGDQCGQQATHAPSLWDTARIRQRRRGGL